jgi:hypothetical protein
VRYRWQWALAGAKTGKVVEYHYNAVREGKDKNDNPTKTDVVVRCDSDHPSLMLRRSKTNWDSYVNGNLSKELYLKHAMTASIAITSILPPLLALLLLVYSYPAAY